MRNEAMKMLKDEYQHVEFSGREIPNLINPDYLKDDNEKYMKSTTVGRIITTLLKLSE